MKKSVEILDLPIISITEGRELGMSKSLLIDAKNGRIAAITIEDEDWYRGVKLLPYESVIAIGEDAVTITNSENIITLEDAGDYETLLDDNIRVIGTKAITRSGTIQGKISEMSIGDDGKIEKCEITAPDGTPSEIPADQISIFGKQVTVIDPEQGEKKTESVSHPAKAAAKPGNIPSPAKAEPSKAVPQPSKAAPAVAKKAEEKPAPAKEAVKPATPAPAAQPAAEKPDQAKQLADKATEERHRRFLLGKKAARTIKTDNGIVIVEAGKDITEEVLQKAKLANKFIELSMNIQ